MKQKTRQRIERIEKELWSELKKWLRMTKVHKPDRLVISNNNTLRFLWLACFSTGLLSFLIAKSVTEFHQFEVKTRIKEVCAEEVPFPQVSICNSNPLVTRAANDYINEFILNIYNISASNYSDLKVQLKSTTNDLVDDLLKYIQYMTNDPNLNDSVKKLFGYDLTFGCRFNKNIDCSDLDKVWFFDPTYGSCYKFNPSKYSIGSKRDV
jgi:hypothetical protein